MAPTADAVQDQSAGADQAKPHRRLPTMCVPDPDDPLALCTCTPGDPDELPCPIHDVEDGAPPAWWTNVVDDANEVDQNEDTDADESAGAGADQDQDQSAVADESAGVDQAEPEYDPFAAPSDNSPEFSDDEIGEPLYTESAEPLYR